MRSLGYYQSIHRRFADRLRGAFPKKFTEDLDHLEKYPSLDGMRNIFVALKNFDETDAKPYRQNKEKYEAKYAIDEQDRQADLHNNWYGRSVLLRTTDPAEAINMIKQDIRAGKLVIPRYPRPRK